MPLSAGSRLGPYEILSPLGQGGMGEVWKARDTRLGRIVAIKQCKSDFSDRFLREARAVAALSHPNVCTLFDVGPDYLVMEYIEGTSPRGPMPPEDVVRVALGIADALAAAHARGITHRDLKPGNVLVTTSGVKLLDFGLATPGDTHGGDAEHETIAGTAIHEVVGTVAYMSPEQAQGLTVDHRSDIFSFGAVLYQLLSGHQPFDGRSPIETAAALLRDAPPPLDAPPALLAIVDRCLAKDPADRFQAMADVRTALEEARREPVAAPVGNRRQPSIAVLPFMNLSADKENEYFGDGLAEEILNLLAKIPDLRVIARTSSFTFRGRDEDVTTIARSLAVDHVLEGSVRKAGNRIRISAQLVRGSDGTHVWSERYDRDMTDVFAIQDEIGQAISSALRLHLAPRVTPVDIGAYQDYLKGQFFLEKYSTDYMQASCDCFERAAKAAPDYAPAHSSLALQHFLSTAMGLRPAAEAVADARAAAAKALAIDPGEGEAHSILATLAATYDYDWPLADHHHRLALAASVSSGVDRPRRFQISTNHLRYVLWFLGPMDRGEEAIVQSQVALETDPLSPLLHSGLVFSFNIAQRHDEAIEAAERALEIDPGYHLVRYELGTAQFALGRYAEAAASFARVVETAPWEDRAVGALCAALHLAGDGAAARASGARLLREQPRSFGAAIWYAASGEVGAMLDALTGAHADRIPYMLFIQVYPYFAGQRADARFSALSRTMGLPERTSRPHRSVLT